MTTPRFAPPVGQKVIYEGDQGVFSQSWFPICRSEDVPPNTIVGRDFLGGQVVVVRGGDQKCSVMSAYCLHIGANLKVGRLLNDQLECAFHCWKYDLQGRCTATGSGDPPPPGARLFKFPTIERWGLIWAFNGEKPLFELPAFDYPDDQLVGKTLLAQSIDLDPWIVMCNTLDFQHLKVVHGMQFGNPDPDSSVTWNDHSVLYDIEMTRRDTGIVQRVKLGVYGTNIFYRSGSLNGRYIASITPCALLGPGRTDIYLVQLTTRGSGSPEELREADEFLDFSIGLSKDIITEDKPIMTHLKFNPRYLTRSDKHLARFLQHLRRYPRAHPAAAYIN